MNILVTNDDGIDSRGLSELVKRLSSIEGTRVFVCAPDGQRSASGHGITMTKPMSVSYAEIEGAEVAYKTSGLPADCVKIAVELLERKKIALDMVFSGINHGGNLGTDTLYSGTVAGALEGSICDIPAVAVSVDSHHAEHFELACDLAEKAMKSLAKQIEDGTVDYRTVLNINTPNLPKEEIKGVKFTRLGDREYDEEFAPLDGGENMDVPGDFKYYGTPVHYEGLPDDIDVIANQNGFASITPINVDLTDYDKIEKIKSWGLV